MTHFLHHVLREATRLRAMPAASIPHIVFSLKRTLRPSSPILFLAAVPKSASTFLRNALSAVTGLPVRPLLFDPHGWREQDLYFPRLVDAYRRGSVTRHHTRATRPSLELMKMFEIRPVIVVRNFFDVVPSILDHFAATGKGFDTFPFLYCNEKFPELPENVRADCIIEMAMPWYFSFYVSWFDACATGQTDGLWISFEEMVHDWPPTIRKILTFHGIDRSDDQIGEALEKTFGLGRDTNRLNQGKVGRGGQMLSEEQRGKILAMARFYPWVDFSRVGIPPAGGRPSAAGAGEPTVVRRSAGAGR
jgi:hypothetical protein